MSTGLIGRIAIAALCLAATAAAVDKTPSSEPAVPALVVTLMPAVGYVPLESHDELAPYKFEVSALDERHAFPSVEVFIRPGQDRRVEKGNAEGRIRASVKLADGGLATYRVELIVQGKTVAQTRATVRFEPSN